MGFHQIWHGITTTMFFWMGFGDGILDRIYMDLLIILNWWIKFNDLPDSSSLWRIEEYFKKQLDIGNTSQKQYLDKKM